MSSYGDRYWRIGVAKDPLDPAKDSEEDVYINADELEVSNCGALIAWGGHRRVGGALLSGEKIIVCAFAPGQWFYFFAASVLDGSPVCVEEHD